MIILKLEQYKKKINLVDKINLGTVIFIIMISAVNIYFSIQAEVDPAIYLFAIFSLVIGIVSLIVGRILPSKASKVQVSQKQKIALSAANAVLNKRGVVSPTTLEGSYIYRNWNFLAFLIVSSFMMLFSWAGAMVCSENRMISYMYCVTLFLWFALLPLTGLWTYYDGCIADMEVYGETYD